MTDVEHFFSRSITAKIMTGAVLLFAGGLFTIGLMLFMVNRQVTDAAAINEASSLRVIIQQVAKAGARVENETGSKKEMRTAMEHFERRLTGLMEGNPEEGVGSAPAAVQVQLMGVKQQWEPYKKRARRLLESERGSESFQVASQYLRVNDATIHRAADRAVELYQAESEGKINRMKNWLHVLLGLSFVVFGSVFWITRRALRPIHALAEAANQVQDGKLDVQVEIDTRDELGQLARSFNQMIGSIRRSQRTLRAEKERAEEMSRLKSAFLANMSHEIRTPLSSIIGFSEVLGDEIQQLIADCTRANWEEAHETLGDTVEYAGLIHESGERLLNTLNSVLELSKLEAKAVKLEFARFDVCQEVRDVLDLFRQRTSDEGVKVQAEGLEVPIWVTLDAVAVRRIVVNLFSNAVKFTPREGEVVVRVQATATQIRFEVEDSGIGISDEFLPTLFTPFRQESTGLSRSHEGTGLGLAIVRQLIELMDGRIEVESEKGVGTLFIVTLPRWGGSDSEVDADADDGMMAVSLAEA